MGKHPSTEFRCLWCAFLLLCHTANASRILGFQIKEQEVIRYITRPELSAPLMKIHRSLPELEAPGYLFFAPWKTTDLDVGPYIYDSQGHLIWSGISKVTGELVVNFHECGVVSKPHLCFFEGRSKDTWGRGRGIILDDKYRVVATTQNEASSDVDVIDMHEFDLTDDGKSALVTSYSINTFDGTYLNMVRGFSWLLNSHFKEINMTSRETTFAWNAHDHIDPTTSLEGIEAPIGMTRLTPYDFFHINSVTKSLVTEDYIISARHMDAIYKISHRDGRVLWQLGGSGSSFATDFELCHQHHVRIQHESRGKIILSIFNNGCFRSGKDNIMASGMLVEVDQFTMTARILQDFKPQHDLIVGSQGSIEIQPNGNALIGWGLEGMITEHLPNGTIVFNATLGGGIAQSYRAYKAEWHGFPLDRPEVYSFAKTPDARTYVYASWNGATEVKSWKFYGQNESFDEFECLGTIDKDGFETNFTSNGSFDFVYVEALSKDGKSLGNSSVRQTFIPSPELAAYCSAGLCPMHSLNLSLALSRDVEATQQEEDMAFFQVLQRTWVQSLVAFSGIFMAIFLAFRYFSSLATT